jgi:hypothetical protein
MSESPSQTTQVAMANLNRYGRVKFVSDRPDLQGLRVQTVMYADGRLLLYRDSRVGLDGELSPVYEMTDASASYETSTTSLSRRTTPNWAIAAAIIGFFFVFLLSLLFLLVKETKEAQGVLSGRFVDQRGRTLLIEME